MPAAASENNFRRRRWMLSGHIETIAAALGSQYPVQYEREIIKTREQDPIVLDYVKGAAQAPLLIMFHGLEGCSQSNTLRMLARSFINKKWTVAVPHFRSCGGINNRLPRAYHAADAADVEWMISYCSAYFSNSNIYAIGVSLGGSALIHHLITGKFKSPAAVISTPFDLTGCVEMLDGKFINRRIYARHFLKSLRPKIIEKAKRFPKICDIKKLKAARTIGEFDQLYTAPVHGFADAFAYWKKASTGKLLHQVASPLLCVNALNDPLIPPHTLPPPCGNPLVSYCRPEHGGHGAFIGNPPDWLADTVYHFFQNNTTGQL